jgi:protein OS-9
MTTTDSIFFIKETKTCHYTLVIHTPRLCGEPGFRSPREDVQDTPLRCRKVVDTLEGTDPTLPESPLPFQRREPKPLPAPRQTPGGNHNNGGKLGDKNMDGKDPRSHMIKAALDALLGRTQKTAGDLGAGAGTDQGKTDDNKHDHLEGLVAVTVDDDGELRVEKLRGAESRLAPADDGDDGEVMEIELAGGEDATRLLRILREAGYDAVLPTFEDPNNKDEDEELKSHDEL